MASRTSPISARPSSRLYQDYVTQQQCRLSSQQNDHHVRKVFGGPQLLRQMMIGFTCAGCVGLIMLVLGVIFIAKGVSKQQPITVMLCVMGIVFGIIIIAGTIILGRLLITRKCDKCQGRNASPSQCFHTCSIIYSPSLDQMGTANEGNTIEPPPSYTSLQPLTLEAMMNPISVNIDSGEPQPMATMVLMEPPKYEEANHPLPEYQEKADSLSLPPYEFEEGFTDK